MCEQCEAARRSTAPRWRGRYDRAALKRACDELGVRRPVRLICEESGLSDDEPLPAFGIGFGYAGYDEDEGHHVVSVSRNLPLDTAGNTLLHELTHCAQTEREGEEQHRTRYSIESERHGYFDNRYEREARETAEAMYPRHASILREGEVGG